MIIEHFKSFYPHFQIDPKSIYCIKIVKIWCLTTIYCVYLRFNTRILFIPESTEGVAEGQTSAMQIPTEESEEEKTVGGVLLAMYWNYLSIGRWVLFIPESLEGFEEGKTNAMKKETL